MMKKRGKKAARKRARLRKARIEEGQAKKRVKKLNKALARLKKHPEIRIIAEKKPKKYAIFKIFLMLWTAALAFALFSIIKKDAIAGIASFFVMFLCSYMAAKTNKNLKDNQVIEDIRKACYKKIGKNETNFDVLLEVLDKHKKLSINHVKKGFGISRERAEEWADILESHELLKIRYPTFGSIELIKK